MRSKLMNLSHIGYNLSAGREILYFTEFLRQPAIIILISNNYFSSKISTCLLLTIILRL